jgi:hypothetical protein
MELLALPTWKTSPTTLEQWRAALSAQGHAAVISREGGETWLEVGPLRVRGYVSFDGSYVEAINFELHDADPDPATRVVDAAALALGWEIHPDEPEEDDLDED